MNNKPQSGPAYNLRKRCRTTPNVLDQLKKDQPKSNSKDENLTRTKLAAPHRNIELILPGTKSPGSQPSEPLQTGNLTDDNKKRRLESIDDATVAVPNNHIAPKPPGCQPSGSRKTGHSNKDKDSLKLQFYREEECRRLLYVHDLSPEIKHHELFAYFCTFGNLKSVTLLNRNEHYKFAAILYTSEESREVALRSNPHKLCDKQYYCHKGQPWHRSGATSNWRPSEPFNYFQTRLSSALTIRQYIYPTADSFKSEHAAAPADRRLSLLPDASVALLYYLRKGQPRSLPIIEPVSNPQFKALVSSMDENFSFVRHSYTNFVAYKKQPGQYESLPIDAKIGLTAIDYADLRGKEELRFYYTTDDNIVVK